MELFRDSLNGPHRWNPLLNSDKAEPVPAIVESISLSLMDEATIRRLSVTSVNAPTLYEKSLPRTNGVNDVRMGPTDRKLRCGTCLNGMMVCVGHSGLLELPKPMYHGSFLSDLVKILRSVCPLCYTLVGDRFVHSQGKQRFQELTLYLKSRRTCVSCDMILPTYCQQDFSIRRDWSAQARAQFDNDGWEAEMVADFLAPFNAERALNLLRLIDDSTFRALGLVPEKTHPTSFILKVLLVPPPIIRPSIQFSESSRTRGQDDLTHKLQEILKATHVVDKELAKGGTALTELDKLQALIATFYNNESAGAKKLASQCKKRSGQPEKCVVKILKGKQGLFRNSLMGKRVDFSSRTVISPDSVMGTGELGVPYLIAKKLTKTIRVTAFNMAELQARVWVGEGKLNGARSVIKPDGSKLALELVRNRHQLRIGPGWQVERYLQNGDIVLFNRQPTLRKKSMMAHAVRLRPGKTFRLNLAATATYNADFDGFSENTTIKNQNNHLKIKKHSLDARVTKMEFQKIHQIIKFNVQFEFHSIDHDKAPRVSE